MSQKYTLIVAGFVIASLLGVILAWRVDLMPSASDNVSRVQYAEIKVGTLPQGATAVDPGYSLLTKPFYYTYEPLLLRVVSTAARPIDIPISVRLLDEQRRVVNLNPASITVSSGTSGYCCWLIEEPGAYTLQVFRPGENVVTFPVTVRFGVKPQQKLL